MIDTGAQKTVVEKKLAEQLGLVPIRFQPMVGVSQKPELCPVYLMSVSIGMSDGTNTGFAAFETEVIGMASPPRPQGHQGLLGRDFLRHMRFVYNGPTGTFEVSAAAFAQQAKGISPLAAAAAGGTRGPTPEQLRKAKRKAEKAARRKNRHR